MATLSAAQGEREKISRRKRGGKESPAFVTTGREKGSDYWQQQTEKKRERKKEESLQYCGIETKGREVPIASSIPGRGKKRKERRGGGDRTPVDFPYLVSIPRCN